MVDYAKAVAYQGSKVKPEKYAQLNELVCTSCKSFEKAFGDCGD